MRQRQFDGLLCNTGLHTFLRLRLILERKKVNVQLSTAFDNKKGDYFTRFCLFDPSMRFASLLFLLLYLFE